MPRSPIPSHAQTFPRGLSIYLPLIVAIYPLVIAIPALNWEANVYREYGMIENVTVICLALGSYWGARAMLTAKGNFQRVWLFLLAFGAFLFLGEEISWGQHYFKWTTPDEWKAINRQDETSLHNVEGWAEFIFTKVARNGLCSGAIIGSIIIPWWLRRKPALTAPGTLHFWLWPSSQAGLVAVMANLTVVPRKIAHIWDYELPHYYGLDDGEMKECYLAIFIMMYALVQWRMARSQQSLPGGS